MQLRCLRIENTRFTHRRESCPPVLSIDEKLFIEPDDHPAWRRSVSRDYTHFAVRMCFIFIIFFRFYSSNCVDSFAVNMRVRTCRFNFSLASYIAHKRHERAWQIRAMNIPGDKLYVLYYPGLKLSYQVYSMDGTDIPRFGMDRRALQGVRAYDTFDDKILR